jgi:hypothetical protein
MRREQAPLESAAGKADFTTSVLRTTEIHAIPVPVAGLPQDLAGRDEERRRETFLSRTTGGKKNFVWNVRNPLKSHDSKK